MRSFKSKGGMTSDRSLFENCRNLWALTLTTCANVYNALIELVTSQRTAKNCHKELRRPRKKMDFKDYRKCFDWLIGSNFFHVESQHLHSTSTVVVFRQGKDENSCERAEEIGKSIQRSFDNLPLSQCKIPRSKIVERLSLLQANPKKIGNDQATTDSCTVFNRFLAVASRLDSVKSAFS